MKKEELSPPDQLMKMIVGKWISKPIYAAAELGIADLLAEGPMSIDELSEKIGAHAPFLYRVMRALASVGIFVETKERCFELTPMAEYLKTGLMRSIALMFNAEWNDNAWLYFLDSIKTGECPFEKAHGMPVSDWLDRNPGAANVFNEANAVKAGGSHRAIIDAYDFSDIDTLTDVGGGLGVLMAEILSANPHMKGVIADTPAVIKEADQYIRTLDMQKRCQAIPCDFFKNIPPGSDACLMSNILHDWPDEKCQVILENCHRAMKPGSKLLIVEIMIPCGNEPSVAKLLDLEMLVITGGRERTKDEFYQLLESSGFRFSRIIPTQGGVCIIEGIRV